ncbi:MAG: universal stress protein [Cyanobacteria bacterium]|nr:universal stress protein [Cyanobacteriota bacterium]
MKKIILAIDDSTYSQQIIDSVANRKWSDDFEVKILTVLEPLDLDDADCQETLSEINHKRKEQAEKLLEKARKTLSERLNSRIHFEIREGNPKTEILDVAAEWAADKILLGAHGHGAPTDLSEAGETIGSIPRMITEHAPCSVEILRTHIH